MASKRRLGSGNSATRNVLMDAVEAVMREDGYAALSARSVAEKVDLKHQLVYYYFETLDELLLATYRRHIGRYWDRLQDAFQSERPLHAFWKAHSDPNDSVLNMEFLAMANHNEVIRRDTVEFGERVRRLGLETVDELIRRPDRKGSEVIAPFAVTMVLSSIGMILGLETSLGIAGGHQETRALIEWCIDELEPA